MSASLGGIPFHSGPDEVRWDYSMRIKETKTLGGKVIQILGVDLGDMTVHGRFGVNRGKGDTEAWQDEARFRKHVREWTKRASNQHNPAPVRFTFAPRGWDFRVYIKSLSSTTHDVRNPAPEFTITMHVLEDGARALVKDTKDLYLHRLMAGVGWKQTDYNGPTDGQLQNLIGTGSVGDYIASLAQKAFESGLPGGSVNGP